MYQTIIAVSMVYNQFLSV